jgi:hypothetical protein
MDHAMRLSRAFALIDGVLQKDHGAINIVAKAISNV